MGLVAVCAGLPVSVDASPRAEIEPLFEAMQAAANVHDVEAHLAPMLRDPSLVFLINGLEINGWAGVRDQQRKWWPEGKTDVRYTPVVPTRYDELGPDTVMVTARLRSERTGADGTRVEGLLAITQLWRRLPQGWRIVLVHESTSRS